MSLRDVREPEPSMVAGRVILTCGLVMAVGFGIPAFGPGGDLFMKAVTVLLAVGTPIAAYFAVRRARVDGDVVGMKR